MISTESKAKFEKQDVVVLFVVTGQLRSRVPSCHICTLLKVPQCSVPPLRRVHVVNE
uniref:Uncharacterized protein n=1 Tax=Anguilla anguilla TaxID=7936 RepID=A0A0E9VYH2_ANGAN